jgi:outer membrane lipoprotein-sorting protein
LKKKILNPSLFFSALFLFGCLALPFGYANKQDSLTAEEIIARMDKNNVFETRKVLATMRIHRHGQTRTKTMRIYSKGEDASFTEFLTPARDKGVKYLKLKDNLWMYMPSAEKVIKISGHMLRQSMMGSDFSYEDMLDASALKERYSKERLPDEIQGGERCYVLKMKQKKEGETYPVRKVWISQKTFTAVRSELYALSGRLLKVMAMSNVKRYGERYYATVVRMENRLQKGTWTESQLDKIEFHVQLPEQVFSLRNLQRE